VALTAPQATALAATRYNNSSVMDETFSKARVVAAGVRVFKTTASTSEGGILDILYSQDGIPWDSGANVSKDLARPKLDRARHYLAQVSHDSCRGRAGFVVQNNYRPFEEIDFEFREPEESQQNTGMFAPGGDASSLWVTIQSTANPVGTVIMPFETWIQKRTADNNYPSVSGIVLNSFQQRHTAVVIATQMSAGLGITIERMAHYEGVADQSHYGFVSANSARLETVNTPLDLIAKYNVQHIFSTYESRRTALMEEILRGHIVTGFWSETLFPSFKDLVRYGADYLQADDKVGTMVKAGVDTAAATLGALYPQLIPYLSVASSQLGDAA